MCKLRRPPLTCFFWQMLQTSQVPSSCDSSRCCFSCWDHVKRSEQCLHECSFVSVWIRSCCFKATFILNIFPQKEHWYGLLLLCTWCLCFCKLLDPLKLLLHSEHLYGLSPVWTLMCMFRLPDTLNALSHMWHLYGLSPVWTLMCAFRCPDWLNTLSHMWHLYGLSPLWILLWVAHAPDVVKRLLQTAHSNGFSPKWLRLCTSSKLLSLQHWVVKVSCEVNTVESVHKYSFAEWCLLLWTCQLSSSKELPVHVKDS